MKGFGKRLAICLLLMSLLIVTVSAASAENCPGNCTHQAAVGTTHFDTLEEAVAAADAGKTVILLTDTILTSPVTLEKNLALDLNGNTLTGNLVFLEGGSIRGGKIIATDGSCVLVKDCTVAIEKDAQLEGCGTAPALAITADKDQKALVNVSGKLSGQDTAPVVLAESATGNCTLKILKDAELTADSNPVIAFDSAGMLEIQGGTIQGKSDLISLKILKNRKTDVSITGGKLLSEQGEVIVIDAEKDAEVPKDFITGGTFQKVPSDYIPPYCQIPENDDGTVTVISAYTLTFQNGGASGTMEPVKVKCGNAYTLPKPTFTPAEGMDFAGWLIGGKTYKIGDSFTPNGDTAITAQWKAHVHTGGKATCLSRAVCDLCGKSYGEFGGHNLSYVSGYAATCDRIGMQDHRKCTVCGSCFLSGKEVSSASLFTAALGHTWETVEGKPATCTEDGLQAHRKCSTCEVIQVEGKPADAESILIPATGHQLEAMDATQATCTDPGIQAHEHCTQCDGLFVKGEAVDLQALTTALSSHLLSDWQTDESYHWKACVDCQEVFRQGRHTDKDADGSCDDCGYVMAAALVQPSEDSNGFSWLFLIPMIAAVVIAVGGVVIAAKKKRNA